MPAAQQAIPTEVKVEFLDLLRYSPDATTPIESVTLLFMGYHSFCIGLARKVERFVIRPDLAKGPNSEPTLSSLVRSDRRLVLGIFRVTVEGSPIVRRYTIDAKSIVGAEFTRGWPLRFQFVANASDTILEELSWCKYGR